MGFRRLIAIFLCALACAASATRAEEPPEARTGTQLVLLVEGGILRGQVERLPRQLVVRTDGGQIRLHSDQVLTVVDSLPLAYEFLRQRSRPNVVADQLQLGEWCLAQGLLPQAEAHHRAALALEPGSRQAARLGRAIQLRRQPETASPIAVLVTPASATRDPDGLPPGISSEAIEVFVRDIQPLVLNACATGSCHGARSASSLRLTRQLAGRQTTRRTTTRNLKALLDQVDRNLPEASPLLKRLSEPHGGQSAAMLTPEQWSLLADWVALVGRPADEPPESARQTASARAPGPTLAERLTGFQTESSASEKVLPLEPAPSDERLAPGNESDPLDPAAFNQRYHAEP